MPTDLLVLLSPKNLVLFIVVFTRLSGMMTTAPLISTYPIPMQIKTWFMAAIAFVIFPIVLAKSGFQLPTSIPELTVILIKEFMIGYVTGFVANVIFIGAEIAADLLSMQMGLTAAQAMNPMTGDTSPILGQAYTLLVSMVFISINAYQWMFSAIYKSFQTLPPGYGFFVSGNLANQIIFMTSQMFIIGLGIALPIFSVLVIVDVLLGFVSKMMPNMNIFMVAMPLKIYIGLILSVMLMQPICSHIAVLIEGYLKSLALVLGGG